MGNFAIQIRGCGSHHNGKASDVEALSEKFVEHLVVAGHSIEDASVTTGGVTPLPNTKASAQPAVWEELERMQGEIAAELRVLLGEGPYAADLFDEEQRQRRIKAMRRCALEDFSDEARHDSWCKMHTDSGWVFGEEFDPDAKTHPNLRPWSELPTSVHSKARIFAIVARAAERLAQRVP